jgi:hypothetical protein
MNDLEKKHYLRNFYITNQIVLRHVSNAILKS